MLTFRDCIRCAAAAVEMRWLLPELGLPRAAGDPIAQMSTDFGYPVQSATSAEHATTFWGNGSKHRVR